MTLDQWLIARFWLLVFWQVEENAIALF
jgi:hypothetical protein